MKKCLNPKLYIYVSQNNRSSSLLSSIKLKIFKQIKSQIGVFMNEKKRNCEDKSH